MTCLWKIIVSYSSFSDESANMQEDWSLPRFIESPICSSTLLFDPLQLWLQLHGYNYMVLQDIQQYFLPFLPINIHFCKNNYRLLTYVPTSLLLVPLRYVLNQCKRADFPWFCYLVYHHLAI